MEPHGDRIGSRMDFLLMLIDAHVTGDKDGAIDRYMSRHFGGFDATKYGFTYVSNKHPVQVWLDTRRTNKRRP